MFLRGRGQVSTSATPMDSVCLGMLFVCPMQYIAWDTIYQTVNDGVAHSKNPKKCAYHVTFDLDLEHTLDVRWPGVHRVQVWWRSGHLPARRSDLRKSLQTDRQTDRRTDDGRLAIVLAHSWNEPKITCGVCACVRVCVFLSVCARVLGSNMSETLRDRDSVPTENQ